MTSASGGRISTSVICKEVFDEGYQPSSEEINEYAIRIGIEPDKEPHLLYLAKDGLMRALPTDWQICYHEPHGIYYYNPKTRERQWDHPLDAEYKLLVEKIRIQSSSADLSEETSQIDSGIKSLQGTEDSEAVIDVSPSVSKTMDKTDLHSNRFLAPIEKRAVQLQPLDVRQNRRFEVTSYASNANPQHIGLNMRMEDSIGTSTFSIPRNDREPFKGMSITGTGSMFLKSKKSEQPDNLLSSSPMEIERKNPVTDGMFAHAGSPTVKSILRDSSLTDVRNRFIGEQKMSDVDGEDRKSVRFNLEKSVLVEPRNSSNESSENDDDDEWDFNDRDAPGSYVKDVKVTIGKNNLVKPTLRNQLSLDELRKPSLNKLSLLNRTFSTDSGTSGASVEKSSLSSLFDRQIDKSGSVKPLYEDTDSESATGSVKRFPRRIDAVDKKAVGLNLSIPRATVLSTDLEDEEEIEKTDIRKAMNERLQLFRNKISVEQSEEEAKIRQQMQKELIDLKKELNEKNRSEIKSIEMNELKELNKETFEKALHTEKESFEVQLKKGIDRIRSDHDTRISEELSKEQKLLEISFKEQVKQLEEMHQNELSKMNSSLEEKIQNSKIELESQHNLDVEKFSQQLRDEFEEKRKSISNEHRSSVEILQRNHTEILQDLERDLKLEEELLRKDHLTNLAQLKDKLTHELECERQRMRETGENHLYEKIRCEKRLLEDKYRCLKEKYVRLKADVKMSLERRNRRKENQNAATGSETERSNSNKHSIGNSENNKSASISTPLATDHGKPPAAPITPKINVKLKECVREKSLEREHVVKEKKFSAAAKYLSHIQQYTDDTTSVSQSDTTLSNNYNRAKYLPIQQTLGENGNSDSEAFRRNQENNNVIRDTPGRQRKKIFTRMKSASTSRLNSSNVRAESARPCTPVENLRRQLQKLEDLEDQFPDNTLDTTYHLRYPFTDIGRDHANTSSELEFFKHRIHMERDSVRRAKESLRTQRTNFRARQREIKQRHKVTSRHTVDQLIQEEKELTEMEVNLHRTRALLGEKVIRLRHLEQSLQRICEKDKPFVVASEDKCNKEDATISDLSSHSSSGFSSTDFASETNHGNMMKRKEMYQESSAIIQSLDNLNTEIREIWEILSKQQTHCLPPPPAIVYQELGWPLLNQSSTASGTSSAIQPTSLTTSVIHQTQPIPTLADRLETYRQIAANRATSNVSAGAGLVPTLAAANMIVSQSPMAGSYTTSLVERTQDLRNWLRQAKNEHELLSIGGHQQANL